MINVKQKIYNTFFFEQELEQEKKEAEEAKRKAKQKSLLGFLQNGVGSNDDEEGSIEISLAGLFKCMFCTHGQTSNEKQQLVAIAQSMENVNKRLEIIERYSHLILSFKFQNLLINLINYFNKRFKSLAVTSQTYKDWLQIATTFTGYEKNKMK